MFRSVCNSLFLVVFSLLPNVHAEDRQPVPDKAKREEAKKLVDQLYKDPDPKRLIKDAAETNDNPAAKYVLLLTAIDVAASKGDAQTALMAVELIAQSFQSDSFQTKVGVVERLVHWAKKPSQCNTVVDVALPVIEQIIANDEYGTALDLIKILIPTAKKGKKIGEVTDLKDKTEELSKAFDKLRPCIKTLEDESTDPKCNQEAGKFYCFFKGDWQKGIANLALGDDAELKAVARQELKGAATAAQQKKLGDMWQALLKGQDGIVNENIEHRVALWYRRALPGLRGISKLSVEQWLATHSVPESPGPIAYALEFNGRTHVQTPLSYRGNKPITIEAITVAHSSKNLQTVVANWQDSGLGLEIKNGRWNFAVRDRKGYKHASSREPVKLRQRVHLAGVFDGMEAAIFVDGKMQSTFRIHGSHVHSTFRFKIGADPNKQDQPEKFFTGQVHAVRISDQVLYRKNFTPPKELNGTPGTILLLNFTEGRGEIAHDSSGNKLHAQIIGANWVKVE